MQTRTEKFALQEWLLYTDSSSMEVTLSSKKAPFDTARQDLNAETFYAAALFGNQEPNEGPTKKISSPFEPPPWVSPEAHPPGPKG